MNFIITGGPVHAYLDSVKIITNKFKGKLMLSLISDLWNLMLKKGYNSEEFITYITTNLNQVESPWNTIYHNGFEDYREILVDLAKKDNNCFILGAAVANLIPASPWKNKFPSHEYSENDIVNVPFKISPRIINEIKRINNKNILFGFKLLDAQDDELLRAAYLTLKESKANAIFANNPSNLNRILILNKECGIKEIRRNQLAEYIFQNATNQYYKSIQEEPRNLNPKWLEKINKIKNKFSKEFIESNIGFNTSHGCIAIRLNDNKFYTTIRNKNRIDYIDKLIMVEHVDHENRVVLYSSMFDQENTKSPINSPLLYRIFETNRNVDHIVHLHLNINELKSLEYAPSGTLRDSLRDESLINSSFNINEHGVYLLFNKEGNLI